MAGELAAYVQDHVHAGARFIRALEQTPRLFGKGEDFPILVYKPGGAGEEEPAAAESYPPQLRTGWDTRDHWWADGSFRLSPVSFRRAEEALGRAEKRWRAGIALERVEKDLRDELKRAEERLKRARAAQGVMPPPCYLAQARPAGAKVDLAAGAALRALLEQPLGSKPEERAKARQDLLAKVKPLSSAEVAWAALLTLGDIREPSQDQIRLVDDFLRALPSPPRFAETFLLHRLAEWEVRRWPGRTVGHLLQAAGDAGLVLAADPNALVWFREPLAAAAEKRRAGERLLFEGRPASYPEAEARLEDARRRYQEVRSQVELLVEARGSMTGLSSCCPATSSTWQRLPTLTHATSGRGQPPCVLPASCTPCSHGRCPAPCRAMKSCVRFVRSWSWTSMVWAAAFNQGRSSP